jgi:ubiquitin C-terminal hydrolase
MSKLKGKISNDAVTIKYLGLIQMYVKSTGHDLDDSYDLYGVSNHMGGLGGGHYIAHVLNHDTDHWYVMDDARVTPAGNMGSPSMPSAYVLFYKKRSTAA